MIFHQPCLPCNGGSQIESPYEDAMTTSKIACKDWILVTPSALYIFWQYHLEIIINCYQLEINNFSIVSIKIVVISNFTYLQDEKILSGHS